MSLGLVLWKLQITEKSIMAVAVSDMWEIFWCNTNWQISSTLLPSTLMGLSRSTFDNMIIIIKCRLFLQFCHTNNIEYVRHVSISHLNWHENPLFAHMFYTPSWVCKKTAKIWTCEASLCKIDLWAAQAFLRWA